MAFDKQRFEALVLYIAHRRRDDERFGRTKLAKALFYSDFAVYQDTGSPLTGATYIRMPFGPFPKELNDAEKALSKRGEVLLDYVTAEYEEKRIVPLKPEPTDISKLFEGWQLHVVDVWTQRIGSGSARLISDLSHKHPGWLLAAETGVEIPYTRSVLPYERPTPADDQHAKEIARERGWLSEDGEWVWERDPA